MLRALNVELAKLKGASLLAWSLAVVCVSPFMSGVPGTADRAWFNSLRWPTFLDMGLANMATWYGFLLFGLVTAFLFGREYGDGVASTVLSAPVRREYIVLAKMIVLAGWIFGLTLAAVVAQGIWGLVLGLDGFSWSAAGAVMADMLAIAAVMYCTLPVVALTAVATHGVFAPMIVSAFAFSAGMLGGLAGWGEWLPWAMPTAIGGTFLTGILPDLRTGLDASQWAIAIALLAVGMAALLLYVDHADVAS